MTDIAAVIELTPERQKRLMAASDEIIDMLKAKTEGPGEAMILLHLCMETLEEQFGITMTKVTPSGEVDA